MIVDPNDAHLIQLINPPINGLHVRVWGERERERERCDGSHVYENKG